MIMLQWMIANAGNAIVLAILLAVVAAVLLVMHRDRKKGGCCGGCSGCSGCGMKGACHKE